MRFWSVQGRSVKMKRQVLTIWLSVILVALVLLYPSTASADMSVLFFDDFDDGDYAGWTANHWNGNPATAPDVATSPEGYSLRGTGSGYSQDPGLNVWLAQDISLSNVVEFQIEMRAKSGPQWPNCAWVMLLSGTDYYACGDYGESSQSACFFSFIGGNDSPWSKYSINANVWHDFAWARDGDGWWSLGIDGQDVWHNFAQYDVLSSFDQIAIHILRNQSEIEWVRISGTTVPVPGAVVLAGLGLGTSLVSLLRRRMTL